MGSHARRARRDGRLGCRHVPKAPRAFPRDAGPLDAEALRMGPRGARVPRRLRLGDGAAARVLAPPSSRRVEPEVDVREQVVATLGLLEVRDEVVVDAIVLQAVVEAVEARDVIDRRLRRVLHRRAGAHDEGPVARLREHHLARRLIERALLHAVGVPVRVRELDHPLGDLVKVAVHPRVRPLAPELRVALLAPRRHARRRHLVRRVLREVAARRDRRDRRLVVVHLAEEELEEHRALVPPVPDRARRRRARR